MRAFGYDIDGFGIVPQEPNRTEPKPPSTPKPKPVSGKLPPPERETVVHVLDKPVKLAKDAPQAPKYEIEFLGGFKRPTNGKFVSFGHKTVQGPGVAAGSTLDTEQKGGDVHMEDAEEEESEGVPENIQPEEERPPPPPAHPPREESPPPLPPVADELAEVRRELEEARASHARDLASHQTELDARERRHVDELNRLDAERKSALWEAHQHRIRAETEVEHMREEYSRLIGEAHHHNALLQRRVQETEATRTAELEEHHDRIEQTHAEITKLAGELERARAEAAEARKELAVLSHHGGATQKMLAEKEAQVEAFRRRTVELENSIAAKEAWHASALENLQAQLRQTHGDRAIRILSEGAGPSRPGSAAGLLRMLHTTGGAIHRRGSPNTIVHGSSSGSDSEGDAPRRLGLDTPMLDAPPPGPPALPPPAPARGAANAGLEIIPQPASDRMMIDLPENIVDPGQIIRAAAVLVPEDVQADPDKIIFYNRDGSPTLSFYNWLRVEVNKHIDANRRVPAGKKGIEQLKRIYGGGLRDWVKRFERNLTARDDAPILEKPPNPKRRQLFPEGGSNA